MADNTTAKPGRPRDPHADQAILAAARDLMAEGGMASLTVEGTAQRAGVAKTTVYRRYPTKLDLSVAAVAELIVGRPEGPSVEGRIREGLDLFERSFGSPGSQAAYLSVAAAAAMNADMHERFTRDVLNVIAEQVAASIQEARDSGDASQDASDDFCYDVLIGTLIHRYVIRQLPADDEFTRHFTSLIRFLYQGCPNPPE